jgi:hypothetical protein
MPMKPAAMKHELKRDKVVIVRERSTGKAFEVTKVTDRHVVVHPGPATLTPKEKLKISQFKRRFDTPAVSQGSRGEFPE